MKFDNVRETDGWVDWDSQTKYIKYWEWDVKHEYQNKIELWLDHRGELDLMRNDGDVATVRLDGLLEALRNLND